MPTDRAMVAGRGEVAEAGPPGLLVMAYGSPAEAGQVEAYYTHIRRGLPPTPDQLADLNRRYRAIGGLSPLAQRTAAQVRAIAAFLSHDWVIRIGNKHVGPFIEDAVSALAHAGVRRAVGLVLAPHYSALSVGEYTKRARAAAEASGIELAMVDSWHTQSAYLNLLGSFVTRARAAVADATPTRVVFTAHSLPSRITDMGDPYPDQLRTTAEAVARRAGLCPGDWSLAWQSAGRTTQTWLGPDILAVLPELAGEGIASVVVCPAGFTSDHLEVLYDLDIEASAAAQHLGLAFTRTQSINDHPSVAQALARIAEARWSSVHVDARAGGPDAGGGADSDRPDGPG
ncbi:MAG: ferrochelatase [Acidimicrobiales bacterium]